MTVIKIASAILFIISIMAIWKNTISFDLKHKITYICISILVIAVITNIICMIGFKNLHVENNEKQKIAEKIIEHIFIPINLLIYSAPMGVTINKFKDESIKKEKLKKRLVIITVLFILILILETNYISNFYRGVLNV